MGSPELGPDGPGADGAGADTDWAKATAGDEGLEEAWGAALAEQGGARVAGDAAADWAAMIEDGEGESLPEVAGNDRVLGQEEIDGLAGYHVSELQASGAGGVRAIVDSGVVQYERLPMLEVVFDRMLRLLSTSLRGFFQDNVEVTLQPITSVRFGDYLDAIPLPTLLTVFKADPWENAGLVTVDSSLVYATLDLLLGGRRGGVGSRLDGRAFTAIETSLVGRLSELILADLEQSFQPLTPVRFAVDRLETNPRFATITRPANAAILTTLRLDMDGRGGQVQVLLPYATVAPIRDQLTQSFLGETLGRDHAWESHLATELWQADLPMRAVLHEMRMPLRRVMDLKVGDTLMLDVKPTDPVSVRCGDWTLTQGRIGRVDGSIAVQVTRPLRRARTTLQAYEASMTGGAGN